VARRRDGNSGQGCRREQLTPAEFDVINHGILQSVVGWQI
jgi:hypothetical protein